MKKAVLRKLREMEEKVLVKDVVEKVIKDTKTKKETKKKKSDK